MILTDVVRLHVAPRLGEPVAAPQADTDSRYHRHQHAYGQESLR